MAKTKISKIVGEKNLADRGFEAWSPKKNPTPQRVRFKSEDQIFNKDDLTN
jgi:hypothetical protein